MQHRTRQSEWAPVKREPDAWFLHADGFKRNDRAVCGPLRFGTAQDGVGPRGPNHPPGVSDYGKDRVSPRGFDPMGTALRRIRDEYRESPHIHGELPPRPDRRSR